MSAGSRFMLDHRATPMDHHAARQGMCVVHSGVLLLTSPALALQVAISMEALAEVIDVAVPGA